MYDVGYHNLVNIDISETVVKQMKEKNSQQRPDMQFQKMDVLNVSQVTGTPSSQAKGTKSTSFFMERSGLSTLGLIRCRDPNAFILSTLAFIEH